MLDKYNVVGFFADAAFFESMIGAWEKDYGKKLKVGPRKSGDLVKFYTNNWKNEMYQATENAATGFRYPYEEPEGRKPALNSIALLADPRLINHFRHPRRVDSQGVPGQSEQDRCLRREHSRIPRTRPLSGDSRGEEASRAHSHLLGG